MRKKQCLRNYALQRFPLVHKIISFNRRVAAGKSHSMFGGGPPHSIVVNRWDEKAGLRRDAVRSQVIDVLEAQEIKETGMKKLSTTTRQAMETLQTHPLTIGLDLGDRSSYYCVLEEAGRMVVEEKVSTTPKALEARFGAMPRSRSAGNGDAFPLGEPAAERVGTRDDCGRIRSLLV
jgi:hypothetical protein